MKTATRVAWVAAIGLAAGAAQGANGQWNVDAAGTWATAGNWLDGIIPGSTLTTDNADTATFAFPLTVNRNVTVDTDRNIGEIVFQATTSLLRYNLTGGSLNLSDGGTIRVTADSIHTTTMLIQSALEIQGDGGSATITSDSTTAASILTIQTGGITGVSTAGNTTTLTLNGANTGVNAMSPPSSGMGAEEGISRSSRMATADGGC